MSATSRGLSRKSGVQALNAGGPYPASSVTNSILQELAIRHAQQEIPNLEAVRECLGKASRRARETLTEAVQAVRDEAE